MNGFTIEHYRKVYDEALDMFSEFVSKYRDDDRMSVYDGFEFVGRLDFFEEIGNDFEMIEQYELLLELLADSIHAVVTYELDRLNGYPPSRFVCELQGFVNMLYASGLIPVH